MQDIRSKQAAYIWEVAETGRSLSFTPPFSHEATPEPLTLCLPLTQGRGEPERTALARPRPAHHHLSTPTFAPVSFTIVVFIATLGLNFKPAYTHADFPLHWVFFETSSRMT